MSDRSGAVPAEPATRPASRARARAWHRVYSGRRRADEYHTLMRVSGGKWYLDMLSAAVQALSFLERHPAVLLELGVGTGRLSSRILRRFPKAFLYGLDGSQAMLEKARRRLRRYGRRTRLRCGDFSRRGWNKDLPECDAVISTIAVHHLADAAKMRLFQDAFAMLRHGGIFINGDAIRPARSSLREANDFMWASYIQGRLSRLRGEEKPVASILRWIDRTRAAEGDRPASLESQLEWLREAGFKRVDCFWKNFGFAVFGGTRT